MILHFYLRYSTQFGQNIFVSGNRPVLGNDDLSRAFALEYLDDQFWHGSLEIHGEGPAAPLRYRYLLRQDPGEEVIEFGDDRIIDLHKIRNDKTILLDTWNYAGNIENAFFSAPFSEVLLKTGKPSATGKVIPARIKKYTHEFRVKAPLLEEGEALCISGSGNALNDWKTEKILPLSKNNNWWSIRVDLLGAIFPITYKYGICQAKDKKFIRFEEGKNRVLPVHDAGNCLTIIHDGFAAVKKINWKGAGVAIPVFSLRSRDGFGTGEFNDLKMLVDWARKTGLKMIQLLPINDTTATHTWKDSYPYSAISAFALHPLFLNLDKVAGTASTAVIKPLAKKKKQLNRLPDVDYALVMQFKLSTLRELYDLHKGSFKDDFGYITFFELNRHWLVPYAAFSCLRDKYSTSEFSKWKSHAVYNQTAIQRFVSPSQKHYHEVAFYYFIQYHLHLQLKEASLYAHQNGIIIKGDIPIGICANSVDAWMEPALYHMDEQAGAPPDDFSVKGQNWGFPTYNWKKMQGDDFTWWRKRFDQMSAYFDAFRIDHILGFFRIWSIPAHAVEGIMGRFVPALPVSINEFFEQHILFDLHRYTRPYITNQVLSDLFGKDQQFVKDNFLDGFEIKEAFNTQRKVEKYFDGEPGASNAVRQGLFDLISNVIVFEEPDSQGQQFHFRIGMENTTSFRNLDKHSRDALKKLYIDYFYQRQEALWKKEALKKLPGLKRNTGMLVCGEDLGMVPHCVPEVMEQLGILSLEIQRMPKKTGTEFFHPKDAPYLSVVSPATHDMSTIRGWWEEDTAKTKRFYNSQLGHAGESPFYCEDWINKEIVLQHLYSPAMWSIFQLQDLLGISSELRRENPEDERINIPSNPDHYWRYRVHLYLEDLLKAKSFNEELKGYVKAGGR